MQAKPRVTRSVHLGSMQSVELAAAGEPSPQRHSLISCRRRRDGASPATPSPQTHSLGRAMACGRDTAPSAFYRAAIRHRFTGRGRVPAATAMVTIAGCRQPARRAPEHRYRTGRAAARAAGGGRRPRSFRSGSALATSNGLTRAPAGHRLRGRAGEIAAAHRAERSAATVWRGCAGGLWPEPPTINVDTREAGDVVENLLEREIGC